MKVLVLTNMYPRADRPSYGVFVKRQVDAVRALGHPVREVVVDGSRHKSAYATGFWRLARAVAAFRPDLIHAHHGLCGFMAAHPKHVPLVTSLVGDDVLGTPDGRGGLTAKSRLQRELTRLGGLRADRIIVKSEEMARIVERWGLDPPHVIPNGVDIDFFRPADRQAARRRLGLDPHARWILFPSTPYEYRKRVDLAEAAVGRLRERGHDARLLVSYHRPQSELVEHYAAADAMVLTSEWEGSPNVLKEAMACELPTVSFDVGDASWLCSGTAFHKVVSRGDIAALTAALDELLAMDAPAGDGRQRIVDRLSGPAVARRVEAVYREALGARRARLAAAGRLPGSRAAGGSALC